MEEGTALGASRWHYVVDYQKDVGLAFEELRHKIFGEMTFPFPKPSSIDELFEDEFLEEEGTHSALDISEFAGVLEDGEDDEGVMRLLPESETIDLFGTGKPSVERFEQVYRDAPRSEFPPVLSWAGCCVVLYDVNGEPSHIAFWGKTGS